LNSKLDVTAWGPVVASGVPNSILQKPLQDGMFEIHFGEKTLYMKISNSQFLDSHPSVLVCLNAAIRDRQNKTPPYFSGEGVSNSTNSCLISFSDPSTHIDKINLGWYIGNENWLSFQSDLAQFLDSFAEKISKRLVFLGGSGGGFASFALSKILKRPAIVIGMNPQFDISLYPFAKEFATKAFPSAEISTKEDFLDRKNEWNSFFRDNKLITLFQSSDRNPLCEYILLQSWNDRHHLRLHTPLILPKIKEFSLSDWYGHVGNLSYIIGPWGDSHSVVWREHIILCLKMAMKGETSHRIIESLAMEFLTRNPNELQYESTLSFPPVQSIGQNKARLNLVKLGASFFENSELSSEMLNLSFLHSFLQNGQNNLDVYVVLAALQCWQEMVKNTPSLENEIWGSENVASRLRILLFLKEEFPQRPAMNHHCEFLINALSHFLQNIEIRNLAIGQKTISQLKEFQSNLRRLE